MNLEQAIKIIKTFPDKNGIHLINLPGFDYLVTSEMIMPLTSWKDSLIGLEQLGMHMPNTATLVEYLDKFNKAFQEGIELNEGSPLDKLKKSDIQKYWDYLFTKQDGCLTWLSDSYGYGVHYANRAKQDGRILSQEQARINE